MKKNQKMTYHIEDAINNVNMHYALGLANAYEMNESELMQAESLILDYVEFIQHPDYHQNVPRDRTTGEYII